MATCVYCGKETSNPKFCNSSCAASYNNGRKPKRVGEGVCETCGESIPKRKRYCSVHEAQAKAEQEIAKRRETDNVRRWKTLTGEWRDTSVFRVSPRREVVFRVRERLLTMANSCGELIDQLLGVCFALPEYLLPTDATRYIALLNALKEHRFRSYNPEITQAAITEANVKRMGFACQDWIYSCFATTEHPLLPAWALDTVEFIQAHVQHHWQHEPETWMIEPLMENEDGYEIFRFGFDSGFKRDFTKRFSGTVLRCRVPHGCMLRFRGSNLLGEGGEFCAVAKRCHTSQVLQDYVLAEVVEPKITGYRLDLGFRLPADLLLDYEMRPILLPETKVKFGQWDAFEIDVPHSWIIAAAHRVEDPDMVAVPEWDAELGPHHQFGAIHNPPSTDVLM